ncbi:hypothetical protein NE237_009285 [Protea cynaroides]|uniref:Uncharacterized protein n=1 Tax=Protea cynaroides TaxID=273540 RepID=A0A9Q0R051_9MAGN|nr:hypothetical protein NE237_009285 [Protea cynaroides]
MTSGGFAWAIDDQALDRKITKKDKTVCGANKEALKELNFIRFRPYTMEFERRGLEIVFGFCLPLGLPINDVVIFVVSSFDFGDLSCYCHSVNRSSKAPSFPGFEDSNNGGIVTTNDDVDVEPRCAFVCSISVSSCGGFFGSMVGAESEENEGEKDSQGDLVTLAGMKWQKTKGVRGSPRYANKAPKIVNVKVSPRPIQQPR